MSNDSHLFHTRDQLENDGWTLSGNTFTRTIGGNRQQMLPLYQGMMTDLIEYRNADVVRSPTAKQRLQQPRYITDEERRDPHRYAMPYYWVPEALVPGGLPGWLLGYGDITGPANERTLVPTAFPRSAAANALPILRTSRPAPEKTALLATLSSFVMDYCVRQKFGRTSLNFFFVRQFPVMTPQQLNSAFSFINGSLVGWLAPRMLELLYSSWDMASFATDMGDLEPPFVWDGNRRTMLRAEMDAAFFHAYGLRRPDVEYIMETFPGAKKKDFSKFGEYRTKRLVLEVFDAMQAAIDTGGSFHSSLTPPPGQGPRHLLKELSA